MPNKNYFLFCLLLCSIGLFAQDKPVTPNNSASGILDSQPNHIYSVIYNKGEYPGINDIDLSEMLDIIVEFRELPLFIQKNNANNSLKKAQNYQERFSQFSNDLNYLLSKTSGLLKSAADKVEIKKEFYKAFYGVNIRIPRAILNSISDLTYVKKVHSNIEVKAFIEDNISLINADDIWNNLGEQGDSIIIGIIDTGIDYLHPDLGGGIGNNFKVIGGYDFVNDDTDPMDDHGHGTHVAGIAAANGTGFKGVAPKASLMALKVLNSGGIGYEDDIISAIELALDPNNDDDFSDKVDILSLSLGGGGSPDDAQSIAIDNAVQLGVVCCIAAGNSGQSGFNTIGSPGTARLAITVGATDNYDNMAYFSSMGPNKKIYSIKPEVLAPGFNIRSTYRDNSYTFFSGTSMATPHVSGLCALLKQVHKNWTPIQIKSALMSSAKLLDQEVMVQGSGRVDGWKAINVNSFLTPPVLNFGLDDVSHNHWVKYDTILVTNISQVNRDYTISATGILPGISFNFSPASFSLTAGDSVKIIFTLDVDNNIIAYKPSGSLAYSGFVYLNSTGEQLHIPWSFVKASTINFTFDKSNVMFLISSKTSAFSGEVLYDDWYQSDFLLPKDTYDILFNFFGTNPPRFVVKENVQVEGIRDMTVNSTEAIHKIEIKGKDDSGNLLSLQGLYKTNFAYLFPDTSKSVGYIFWNSDYTTFYSSDFSNRFSLSCNEYMDNVLQKKVFINQHNLISPLNSDLLVTNNATDYLKTKINVNFSPDAPEPYLNFSNRLKLSNPASGTVIGIGNWQSITGSKWDISLFMTPDKNENVAFSTSIIGRDYHYWNDFNKPGLFNTSPFSVYNNKIVNLEYLNNFHNGLYLSNDDGVFNFGFGPPHIWHVFLNSDYRIILWEHYFRGHHNETRPKGNSSRIRLYDKNRNELASSLFAIFSGITVQPDEYQYEITDTSYFVQNVRGTGTLISKFDLRRYEKNPPTFTSLQIRNSKGIPVGSLEHNESAELRFSGGRGSDYFFHEFLPNAKVFYKKYGTNEWQELIVNKITDDYKIGTLFSADLTNLTAQDSCAIDLRIVLTDAYNNSTEWSLEPAFAVGNLYEPVVPVELISFTADQKENVVSLKWITATETNNRGFEIERKVFHGNEKTGWEKITFVAGNGSSSKENKYSYTDDISLFETEKIFYRLKQIDFDGKFNYSNEIEISKVTPCGFSLYQNYPNPFNSSTIIKYSLPVESSVRITINNILGEVVKETTTGLQNPGYHQLNIEMDDLSSGIYFYSIEARPGNGLKVFKDIKKMLLLK